MWGKNAITHRPLKGFSALNVPLGGVGVRRSGFHTQKFLYFEAFFLQNASFFYPNTRFYTGITVSRLFPKIRAGIIAERRKFTLQADYTVCLGDNVAQGVAQDVAQSLAEIIIQEIQKTIK